MMPIERVFRVQVGRFLRRLNRFLRPAQAIQNDAQLPLRAGKTGIQFDRPALGGFGFLQRILLQQ